MYLGPTMKVLSYYDNAKHYFIHFVRLFTKVRVKISVNWLNDGWKEMTGMGLAAVLPLGTKRRWYCLLRLPQLTILSLSSLLYRLINNNQTAPSQKHLRDHNLCSLPTVTTHPGWQRLPLPLWMCIDFQNKRRLNWSDNYHYFLHFPDYMWREEQRKRDLIKRRSKVND